MYYASNKFLNLDINEINLKIKTCDEKKVKNLFPSKIKPLKEKNFYFQQKR